MRGPDRERAQLLHPLLERVDDADLRTPRGVGRGLVVTRDGDPNRRVTRLPRLMWLWAQHRHFALDPEPTPVPARRSPRLFARRSA